MVQMLKSGDNVQSAGKTIAGKTQLPKMFNELKQRLTDRLQAKVQLSCSAKGSGKISIAFVNEEDLNRIIALLEK
jgi:ParB family chromosome partitioning protein